MSCFIRSEAGQGMVEYGLLIALAVIAVIAAVRLLASPVSEIFTSSGYALSEVAAPGD